MPTLWRRDFLREKGKAGLRLRWTRNNLRASCRKKRSLGATMKATRTTCRHRRRLCAGLRKLGSQKFPCRRQRRRTVVALVAAAAEVEVEVMMVVGMMMRLVVAVIPWAPSTAQTRTKVSRPSGGTSKCPRTLGRSVKGTALRTRAKARRKVAAAAAASLLLLRTPLKTSRTPSCPARDQAAPTPMTTATSNSKATTAFATTALPTRRRARSRSTPQR